MAQINSIAGRYRNPVSGGGLMPIAFTRTGKAAGSTITGAELLTSLITVINVAGPANVTLPTMAQIRAELKNEVDDDSFTFTVLAANVTTPANFVTVVNDDITTVVGSLVVMAGTSGTFLVQLLTSTTMSLTRVG